MAYTYARRVELAQQRYGTDPTGSVNAYTYSRRVKEWARDSFGEEDKFTDVIGEGDDLDFESASILYQAFVLGDEDDYSITVRNGEPQITYVNGKPKGARAKALIDVLGFVGSAEEWLVLYPTGSRFGHLLTDDKPKKRRKRK
jgi:hypothetical protein